LKVFRGEAADLACLKLAAFFQVGAAKSASRKETRNWGCRSWPAGANPRWRRSLLCFTGTSWTTSRFAQSENSRPGGDVSTWGAASKVDWLPWRAPTGPACSGKARPRNRRL